MPTVDDEVKIRIKKKVEVLAPGPCIYPLTEQAPELPITSAQLEYKGGIYTHWNTSDIQRVQITQGAEVEASAVVVNESADAYETLVMVGYNSDEGPVKLAGSGSEVLAAGETYTFNVVFTMPNMSMDIVLLSYHVIGGGRDPCLRDATVADPIYVAAEMLGDPWRNVIVGKPYLDIYAHEWKIPVELVLAPNNVYADAVLSTNDIYYRFAYDIIFAPSTHPSARAGEATTTYPEAYGEGREPSTHFHYYVPLFDWEVPGMKGEVILSGDYPAGKAFQLKLQEFDWATNTISWVGSAEQTIYLGEVIESNQFILRTSREETIYPIEVFKEPIFGFYVPTPLQFFYTIPLSPGLICRESEAPCEFILTEEDGLKVGKLYTFQSTLSVAPLIMLTQVVPEKYVHEFGGTKIIDIEPMTDVVSESICGFMGVEPGSTECQNLLLEFGSDAYYVANAFSRLTRHKTLLDEDAGPDILDIIFVPLALATGAAPAGGAGRKLFGRILAKARKPFTRELNTVGLWIEKNMDLISASVVRGYKSDVEFAVGRLAEAADEISGSKEQLELLEGVKRILEESIEGTNWNTAIGRTEKWIDEITKRLDIAGSKTPPKEVIEKSGVKNAAKHIPGIGKVDIDDLDTMEKARRGARANKGTIVHEGILYDIDKIMVKGDEITQYYKPRLPGLWQAMKRHKYITAGLFSWFVIMGPWFTIDNTQFIIYLLRAAGVLPSVWGVQWEGNAKRRFDAYMQLKDDNCEQTYQAQYILALEEQRNLLDSAEPIPEDKVEKAKYVLSVLYGFDIGDPYEALEEGFETDFDAWNHWYYEITRGCTAPLEPSFGFDKTEYPKPRFQVKVERIIDGDTLKVSCTDEEWPHTEDITVRILGYDTPDKLTSGSTILGYSVRRKDRPEKGAPEDPTTPVLREDYYAPTTFLTNLINKQYVWIKIDPNNQTDTYGRTLATVEVDHEDYKGDLGEEILRKGYAMVFFYTPNALMDAETRGEYIAAETIARNAKLGVWSGEAEALPTGQIRCDSTPNKAFIYIDEETAPTGVTDCTLDEITIGNRKAEFRGLTYGGVECKDCKCGYSVDVKEGEKETVMCNMSAICEIKQPKWEDETGIRWNRFPSIWLDDGITKSSIGTPDAYPFKITFGKAYTGLNAYTIIQNGHGLLARDCDHGEWAIELRLDGYKTLSSAYNFKPGTYKRLIPMLETGSGGGGEIPEEEPEPEPEVGVGYLTINRPIISGTTTEISGHIKVHIDGLYISRYAGYGTTRNIKCCAGCYCNADKDLGDCSLGTHTLKLTKTGYEEWSGPIVLEEGETIEITAKMTPADGTVTGAVASLTTEDLYIDAPSRFSATIVNTGIRTACYRMKFNFNGISPEVEEMYYEYPIRFEDEPDDGWSASIEPGEEVEVAVSIILPSDAISIRAETARYEIGTELQVAEIL
ncbi:MAG: thermonuclease family protein [Euryarchaeota archaeon]|nr:thermonuclease family protein [Euryarchaeota archaeon]